MNNTQKAILINVAKEKFKKFGGEISCIDSTYKDLKLELLTITQEDLFFILESNKLYEFEKQFNEIKEICEGV